MEKRIELEKRARKANQITDLNLDNCRSTSIVGLTDEYTALESLSLINVGLTTLKGFPKLPNLKKLELSDNRISDGLNYLTTSPNLQYLNLSGNKIKDLETLKPLKEFKNLVDVDLFYNEVTQIENYREKIFEMLPSLKFLDGFDANDVEAATEGDDEDDEVNGNNSEDEDKQNAFCLNGLEIDLDELEAFEKRVQAKKAAAGDHVNSTAKSNDETDDLDEYLKELKLKENVDKDKAEQAPSLTHNSADGVVSVESALMLRSQTDRDAAATASSSSSASANAVSNHSDTLKFAIILYWFLAILNLANAAYYSDDAGDDDDVDCEEGESDNSDDVSLSEVYNEDLEEDNSDWDEEDAGEDSDIEGSDLDDADGEANESATAPTAEAAAAENKNSDADAGEEEPQARGKKRKHDG